jgi:hypothetical protein
MRAIVLYYDADNLSDGIPEGDPDASRFVRPA